MRSIWQRRDVEPEGVSSGGAPAGILLVCTANVCRSPVAEAMLRRRVDDAGLPVPVRSAGTHARPGLPATHGMLRAAAPWDLELQDHRSQPVTRELALAHALVVTMEARQRELVSRLDPALGARTFTLPELAVLSATLLSDGPPSGDLPHLVTALHRIRPRVLVDVTDVEDPINGPAEGYVATTRELHELLEPVTTLLAGTLASA